MQIALHSIDLFIPKDKETESHVVDYFATLLSELGQATSFGLIPVLPGGRQGPRVCTGMK